MGLTVSPLRRRGCFLIIIVIVLVPFTILLLLMRPDLSAEQTLSQRLAEYQMRLQYLESMYRSRQEDVSILSQYLGLSPSTSDGANVTINGSLFDSLSPETRAILRNMTSSPRFPSSLRLPTAFHFLPHLLDDPSSLRPSYLLSRGRQGISVVLGIPTVKRDKQSYLMGTLQNLISNMDDEEQNETMIVVFVGETDLEYVQLVAKQIEVRFSTYVENGLIEVLGPPLSYYPNMEKLRQTLNDPPERVKWRSKQNLDFAFLMAYSQPKATFYFQLEDDILAKRGFITIMKKFAVEKTARKDPWFVLDFCQLGFIDLSAEQTLSQRLAEYQMRLQYLESMYRSRQEDVSILSQYLGLSPSTSDGANVTINGSLFDSLSPETRAILRNMTSSPRFPSSLRLPTAFHFLPHLLDDPSSLRPSYLLSRGRQGISVVLGIPTVKRDKQSYLMGTLQNLISNMDDEEQNETMIVVFVGETDLEYVQLVAKQIEVRFSTYVENGLIEVLGPPLSYYPNMEKLRQTLNDPPERVKWRSKQNLDFAFLMAYSQPKATFYFQLEDDILAKRGFITIMKKFAVEKTARKDPWFVLDFCQLGFIGTTSSLRGKVQKLKDKQFGKIPAFYAHDNPAATVKTGITPYKGHTIQRAYLGESFFWGLLPQPGDLIEFIFNKSYNLKKYLFRSGNTEHPSDRLYNTTIEVLPESLPENSPIWSTFNSTADGFLIIGSFNALGIAEGSVEPQIGLVKEIRLHVHSDSENWAILSEIMLQDKMNR